jgi:hypothetical protein
MINDRAPDDLPRAEKPTIRILLYTDDPKVTDDTNKDWGLGLMIDHLNARPPAFANLCVELINRNAGGGTPSKHKLYPELISKYDQIWFFGIHQTNRRNFTLGVLRGGPESELDDKEVAALAEWMRAGKKEGMRGGGVLMTGDHANEPPSDAVNPVGNPPGSTGSGRKHFLGLGRALGHRVPRAGLLRKWKGPPTSFKDDSYNTLVLSFGTNVDDGALEIDPVPQQLILQTFDEKGNPVQGGYSHPLFLYKPGRSIQLFPDHPHEGAVVFPKKFDKRVWPVRKGVQPKPLVVAHGIDKRNAQLLKIVAAYNGDCAEVGRIVADSTWHHYFNVNLESFRSPGDEDSPTDIIGQYYANLALWLSPRKARYEMAHAMIHQLAHHPVILEEAGLSDRQASEEQKTVEALNVGRMAFDLVSREASPCEIHELVQALIPEVGCGLFETLYLPDRASTLSYLPSKELLLGRAVNLYRRKMAAVESSGGKLKGMHAVLDEVVADGFKQTRDLHLHQLSQATTMASDFNDELLRKEKEDGIL